MEDLENLEVWENVENGTPDTQDNSHTDKIERYKQQMEGSKAEAKRMHDMMLEREIKRASQDASSLLELHDLDPRLADEVAKSFGYDDFNDAKLAIAEKVGSWVSKTNEADFQENFEKFYQERKAKEMHEEALKKADKIINKITNEWARERAKKQFDKITNWKQLTIDEAEEFAEMATLFVNKDSLKAEAYDDGLAAYASTGMWMGKKPSATDWKVEVVRNGKIVYLDSNKQ